MTVATSDNGSSSGMAATAKIFQAVQGHWLSACLGVLLELHIADILAKQEGPLSIEQLAQEVGVNAAGTSHLYKVLRVLAQWDMLDEHSGRKFSANEATKQMVRGDEPSLGHLAAHLINKPKWDAWAQLPAAVKQGGIAFAMAHDGQDVYQYGEDPVNAEFGDEFCQSMTYFTRHSLEGGSTGLQQAYPWQKAKCIMDVGGGHGELLSRCMLYAGDSARGLLFDRQMVIDGVSVEKTFAAKGVKDAQDRLSFVVGDVRESFPETAQQAGVDTLVMKHFLSAFSDSDARTIVKNCGEVLTADGRILLLQTLVPEPGDKEHNYCEDGVAPGLFAIEILVQCPGGAWRTLSEWEAIFNSQGFKLEDNKAVGCNMNLMVWAKE